MRTANLDIVAKFVKVILHQNHVNKLNLCNQVGLIALNVIGEVILDGGSIKARYLSHENVIFNRTKNVTQFEELAFTMYVDSEIAQLVRALEKKKRKAISDDRFVYAKKIKYAQGQLVKVGEKLGKLEIEKEKAIENEDYDLAHVKNEDMERIKLDIYKRLNIPTLMEVDGKILKENDENSNFLKQLSSPKESKPRKDMFMPIVDNYVSPEDNIVPALKKGKKTQPSVFPGSDVETGKDLNLGKLTEKERRDASLPIEVFGQPLVEKMYSKSFDQREDAMKEIQNFLEKYQKKGKFHPPNDVLKATSFLLQKALCDKVFSIYTSALHVLAYCFQTFVPAHQVSKVEASFLAEQSMPEVINKLGDTAPRLKNASMEYLTNQLPYSELENLQIIPLYVLSPLQNILNVRLAVGRCELVENLIKIYPPETHSCLSLSKVMPFLVNALQHPSSSVRGTVERIILQLYQHDGNKVRKYLHFDSDTSKKNIMHRRLCQEFDKIDKQKKKNENKVEPKENKNSLSTIQQPDSTPLDEISIMKTCIFCEKKSETFTPEALDEHYDTECPMLIQCSNCNQIVEIAGLTQHLLEECASKDQYKQCPICMEAVPSLNFENHVKIRTCTMAKSSNEANHCPLCHQNVDPGENGWRNHLKGENGCAFNPRHKEKKNSKIALLKKKGKP